MTPRPQSGRPGGARASRDGGGDRRAAALAVIQQLRDQGYGLDYPMAATKVPRQFQTAEQLGARTAILFGDEWPNLAVKNLASGEQQLVPHEELVTHLAANR